MLGDKILVAPVFSDDTALFYLPAGKMDMASSPLSFISRTNRLFSFSATEEVIEGPRWVKKTDYPY
jgi:hypothetical protein